MHPVTGVSPTPEELLTDRNKCWGANLRAIWDARGAMVHDNGNRGATKGHRAAQTVDRSVEHRGGQSLPVAEHSRRPLHADAQAAQKARLDSKLAAWRTRKERAE